MKTNNVKNIFILLGVTVFIIILGLVLMLIDFPIWLNLIIYILLLGGIIWVFKKLDSNYNKQSKPVAVFSFVTLGIFYITMVIVKPLITIPDVCITSYEYLMGYLALNGFWAVSKLGKNKQIRIIGIILFIMSVVVGISALFGLAK